MGFTSALKSAFSAIGVFSKDALGVASRTLRKPVDYIAEKSNFFGGVMEYLPTETIKKQRDSIHTSFSGVKSFMKFGVVFPYLIVLLQQFSAFPSLSCHSSFQVLLEQHK